MPTDASRPATSLRDLSPAYFGMVMATGIVSIAAGARGWPRLAMALYAANIGFYALLWLLYLWRAVRFPRETAEDFQSHARAPGYFTIVAASGVLGAQLFLLGHDWRAAAALGVVAAVLWLLLMYPIYTALTIQAHKPRLERGLNGGWLLAVVATQALAVLGALLTSGLPPAWHAAVDFFALSVWLFGGMLYIWMIALIFYRYLFFPLPPDDLTPPYWINMGAMAISTLAGALLVQNADRAPLLAALLPFIKGVTILYWATGSWWIPMLLLLGVWRYAVKRFPVFYTPLYWGAVFPLGMYAACTNQMARAMGLHFLDPVIDMFLLAAIAAWSLTMLGLGLTLGARLTESLSAGR